MSETSPRKRYSMQSELRALFTLCHDGSEMGNQCASMLLGRVNQDHFVTPLGETVFQRVRFLLRKRGELPEIEDILEDPGIKKDIRNTLREHRNDGLKGIKNLSSVQKLYNRLEDYRKIRALFSLGVNLDEALHADRIDPDKILQDLVVGITNASQQMRNMSVISRVSDNSANEVAKKVLQGNGVDYIPTGIKAYDDINSGIPRGAYMILGASTGGGKSTAVSQIAENMALAGAKVGIVPLEMDNTEMVMRDIARDAFVDLTDLAKPKDRLTNAARKKAYKDYKAMSEMIGRRGGDIKFIEPGGDIDIQTLLAEVKPFDFDVLFIDYIGLLKSSSAEAQWKELQDMSRYAKVWAGMTGCTVIAAAQVDEDSSKIRYSGGITENASYAWVWVKDEIAKQTNIFKVKQKKSRQSREFDFYVYIDSAHMTYRDPTKEEMDAYIEFVKNYKPSHNNEKNKYKSKKTHDYSDDDIEEGSAEDADDRSSDLRSSKKKKDPHGGGKWSPEYKGSGKKSKTKERFSKEF